MKQVIIVRQDLRMEKGKLSAQCSHASVECALKSDKDKLEEWVNEGSKKIILKVKDLKELIYYRDLAKKNKLNYSLIKDAGKTFFKTPTITCLGIGPDRDELIDKVSGTLKML
ncbi:MAG: peptidyl-tRNA hydrolase Pth2 [archaeon]